MRDSLFSPTSALRGVLFGGGISVACSHRSAALEPTEDREHCVGLRAFAQSARALASASVRMPPASQTALCVPWGSFVLGRSPMVQQCPSESIVA